MLKVVETFSGIGSQAKALENIGIDHEILCTADWDINAIIAYDLIHNGKQELSKYKYYSREYLLEKLSKYTLSMNGKKPATKENIENLETETLKRILCAIERTNNLVSVTDIKGKDLPYNIDLLTYSFPCQDLSVAGYWHGNTGGIDRNAHNRSGMLWEIERILKERIQDNLPLPKFLLMENVSNILSDKHIKNFDEWRTYLENIGYYNRTYTLNASNFGIPQKRVRTYMISVYIGTDNIVKTIELSKYFASHNLQEDKYVRTLKIQKTNLSNILKLDYSNEIYKKEADSCQPNDTPSRRDIYINNDQLYKNNKINDINVATVTTKQDRHPNSGVIDYDNGKEGKSKFRYLTPRECFLLMGFEEKDFNSIVNNNFKNKRNNFFNIEKLNKLAGNSIVVNVLEEIFKQVDYINQHILENEEEVKDSKVMIKNTLASLFKINKEEYQLIK